MASQLNAWKLAVLNAFLLINGLVCTSSLTTTNSTSVKVGYLWEDPKQENVHTSEVVMDKKHTRSILRLICEIYPGLPSEGKYWDMKDELVRWQKTGPKVEDVKSVRYWSDDMTKTAISFSNITLDILGSYSCIYGDVSATIDVLVADAETAKILKTPENVIELHTCISYMKDKSGISGWRDEQNLLQPIGTKENCPVVQNSQHAATTVHQLYASDFKVIAAMGDSFTVGQGARATSVNGFFLDHKDFSWSVGGANYLNQTITLPNIIRQFSPSLKGASAKVSQDANSFVDDLNVAFPGASASGLENQARDLVSRMKAMKGIDFKNDWKLLTVWIGTDDLCQVCKNEDKFGAASFIKYMMRTLNYLRNEVPRLFVNLVPPMDISPLYKLHQANTKSCQILGWSSCPCLREGATERAKITKAVKQDKKLLEELVNSGIYDTKDNFAVVIQPALQVLPRNQDGDLVKSFFGVDCLHFSVQGHAAAALALWNNMLEPFGSKTKQWGDQETLKCPSKDKPFLYTKVNSKTVTTTFADDDNDDDDDLSSSGDFPPAAAVAVAVSLTAVVVIVVVMVWRGRKSRRRPEASRLLFASGPHKPRI